MRERSYPEEAFEEASAGNQLRSASSDQADLNRTKDGNTPAESGTTRQTTREKFIEQSKEFHRQRALFAEAFEDERRQFKEQQRQRWEAKTAALEAIEPSGDLVEDIENLFGSKWKDSADIDIEYRNAFQAGDQVKLLEYMRDVEKAGNLLPPAKFEAAAEYFQVFDEVVTRIIALAEQRLSEQSISA